MVNGPFVASIVLPLGTQNDAWLKQSVLSALDQTVPTQVIVVVAHWTPTSNLETLYELNRHGEQLIIIPQEAAGGFAAAINQGVRRATSSRIGILLSDDWLMPDAVAACVERTADIVSTGLTAFAIDVHRNVIGIAIRPLTQTVYDRLTTDESRANYLSHFFLFQKHKILNVGGLDESLGDAPGIDDYDLIWTLLEDGASVSIVARSLYCYRDHYDQRLTLRPYAEQMQTLTKILDKHRVADEQRRLILSAHGAWFGKPKHVIAGLSSGWPGILDLGSTAFLPGYSAAVIANPYNEGQSETVGRDEIICTQDDPT